MTLYLLCQSGNIPYTTLRVSRCRGSQLSVDTIEQICKVLGISMAEFLPVTIRRAYKNFPAEPQHFAVLREVLLR